MSDLDDYRDYPLEKNIYNRSLSAVFRRHFITVPPAPHCPPRSGFQKPRAAKHSLESTS
ncbi:hypothetical protein Vsou_20930 [Vulcanisaeta souniana JCM 11219]|uniref:Uncharacterized protein n=1 Tax=Vulcanisaeta souniana JCM 11219 TaxID=1293586 RepID=A0ABM8BPQ5_9CREN|nr:hypothetical protein Vsou_20930 [Vulcanisaeta souniana JCM 11219]